MSEVEPPKPRRRGARATTSAATSNPIAPDPSATPPKPRTPRKAAGARKTTVTSKATGAPKAKPPAAEAAAGKPCRRRSWRGNPGDTKDAARELSLEAIATLGDIAADAEASPSARVAAATAILDRAFGRPTAAAEDHGKADLARFLASLGPPQDGEGAAEGDKAPPSEPVTEEAAAAKKEPGDS